jgi:hypothetical protein
MSHVGWFDESPTATDETADQASPQIIDGGALQALDHCSGCLCSGWQAQRIRTIATTCANAATRHVPCCGFDACVGGSVGARDNSLAWSLRHGDDLTHFAPF